MYDKTSHALGQVMLSGDIKAEYNKFFAGARVNIYTGNDTPDEKFDYFLSQLKLFVGYNIGRNELRLSVGKLRRRELQTSVYTMTGTATSQNRSLTMGLFATAPKAAMLEFGGEKFKIFTGYYEAERDFLLKFYGGGTYFAGGEANLFKNMLHVSGGMDIRSGEYSGFASVKLSLRSTAVMVEGSQIGVKGGETLVANINQKVGKYAFVLEGHFMKDFTRGLASFHLPNGLWIGSGYQDIAGETSPVLSVGITKFFSLAK